MNPHRLSQFLDHDGPVVRVRLTRVQGSSPREAGAEMFVCDAATLGTIGGGRLEQMAIEAARDLIAAGDLATELDVPLGPEIGQCCGGRVRVALTRLSDADRIGARQHAEKEAQARPHVYLLGAGHVGRALAEQFQHLPFRTILIDQREAELNLCRAAVEKRLSAMPEAEIGASPAGSAFIVLTHDHALDFLLTAAALERGDAAYIGLIGSMTKKARFKTWFRQQGGSGRADALVCPIGQGASRDKRPALIAAFAVAQVADILTRPQTAQQPNSHLASPTVVGAGERHKTHEGALQRGETGA